MQHTKSQQLCQIDSPMITEVLYRARLLLLAALLFIALIPIRVQAEPTCSTGGDAIPIEDCRSIVNETPWAKKNYTVTTNACSGSALPPVNDAEKLAVAIDTYIDTNGGKNSPFSGLGSDIVKGATKAGVNPLLVVAIARKESSYGTRVPAGSFNAFGRTAADGQPSVTVAGRNWYKWPSWVLSVNDPAGNDEPGLLKTVYVSQGLTTIDQVINKYAPPSENDTSTYVSQLNGWVAEMITLAGDALSCSTNPSDPAATSSGNNPPSNPTGNQALGQQMAAAKGWTGEQWKCLYNLWMRESSWKHTATNPSSGAYGIPQALPGNKMVSAGSDWRTNPATQITWGLGYIAQRYKTPCGAWAHSQSTGWY